MCKIQEECVKNYGVCITTTLNEHQSSVMSQLKKAFHKWCKTGKTLPTIKQLRLVQQPQHIMPHMVKVMKKCQVLDEKGEPVLESNGKTPCVEKCIVEEDQTSDLQLLFEWCWCKFVPIVATNKTWKEVQCFYGRMSDYCPPEEEGKVDPKPHVSPSTEAFVLVACENNVARWEHQFQCAKNNEKEDPKHEDYEPHYSSSRSGQCHWGGWTIEG